MESQYDFGQLKIPEKTAVTLRIRAKQLDAYTRRFLSAHPDEIILHLGCGLDSRCLRVPHPSALWFDLDMPDVIELRRKFYTETESYSHDCIIGHRHGLDRADSLSESRPVFVVAEGLLMYLHESERARADPALAAIAFRAANWSLMPSASTPSIESRRIHPSKRRVRPSIGGSTIPHEMETWTDGIRLKEEWFFSQSPDIEAFELVLSGDVPFNPVDPGCAARAAATVPLFLIRGGAV